MGEDGGTVTADELRRVRQWECSNQGHRWNIIKNGTGEPVRILCGNCGESRRIDPDPSRPGYGQ